MGLTDKLKAIGDGFRSSRNITGGISLDEMAVLAAVSVGNGNATNSTKTIITSNGSYTPTTKFSITIEHNLGVVPDIIVVKRLDKASDYFDGVVGFSDAIAENLKTSQVFWGNVPFLYSTNPITKQVTNPDNDWGMLCNTNNTSFTIGGSFF